MAGELFLCCCFLFFFLILPLVIFLIPAITGFIIEKRHLKDLDTREQALHGRLIIHNRKYPISKEGDASLVAGEVVIGADRFKTWLAKWRQLVGGQMGSLAPVMERARREAVLRMAEDAERAGFKEVGNVRFTTANLKWNARQQRELLISVTAYGTAFSG